MESETNGALLDPLVPEEVISVFCMLLPHYVSSAVTKEIPLDAIRVFVATAATCLHSSPDPSKELTTTSLTS